MRNIVVEARLVPRANNINQTGRNIGGASLRAQLAKIQLLVWGTQGEKTFTGRERADSFQQLPDDTG